MRDYISLDSSDELIQIETNRSDLLFIETLRAVDTLFNRVINDNKYRSLKI
jgi:hypothetical protein